jgi:hypothetical protein
MLVVLFVTAWLLGVHGFVARFGVGGQRCSAAGADDAAEQDRCGGEDRDELGEAGLQDGGC